MFCSVANNLWINLYLENKPQIEIFFRRRLSNPEDCKDLEQELFLKVHKLDPNKKVDDPRAYLFKIAHNLVNDLLRNKLRNQTQSVEIAEIQEIKQDTYQVDDQVSDRQRIRILQQAIEELSPKTKEVFLLRKVEDLPNREISKRLGISQNMVEKHLRKALKALRQYLERKDKFH